MKSMKRNMGDTGSWRRRVFSHPFLYFWYAARHHCYESSGRQHSTKLRVTALKCAHRVFQMTRGFVATLQIGVAFPTIVHLPITSLSGVLDNSLHAVHAVCSLGGGMTRHQYNLKTGSRCYIVSGGQREII